MPLNFPRSRKFLLLGLVSAMTFLCPLTSTIFASGIQFVDQQFHNTSEILSTLAVSIFVLGFATGPLFISPLSEIYGRRLPLSCANWFFVLWQIGGALAPNFASILVFRFLTGVGGSGCLTIGAGLIADVFVVEERGMANALFGMGALFGPVLGPVIGGFIAQRAGWRWIFWVLFIASAVMSVFVEIFNKETHYHILMKRKTIRLRKELNRPELQSCYAISQSASQRALFRHGMMRPLKMLFYSPIVFLLATYMAVVYGLLYLIFTNMAQVFATTYHFAADLTGLVFLSLGIGFVIGMASVAKLSDSTVIRMTKANNGVSTPEMRLPACIIYACFVPITFFWFGWTADKAVFWIVPVIGLVPFAIGLMGIFLPIQTYIIDAFPEHAASGVAAITILRSLFGAFLPLAGPSMFSKLGLGWGNSVLGFIAIAVIPFPAFIYNYGGRIRDKYPIQL